MGKKTDISVIIMVLVIVAMAVLGGFAVAPTINNYIAGKASQEMSERINNGTATVKDLANSMGMTDDELLAKFEVKSDDVNADTDMATFLDKLTLKNYCEFMGLSYTDADLDAYKATLEDGGKDVTADTTDIEVKNGFAQYVYALQQAQSEAPVDAEAEAE